MYRNFTMTYLSAPCHKVSRPHHFPVTHPDLRSMRQIFRLETDGASDWEKTAKGYKTDNLHIACPMTTAKTSPQ